MLRYGENPHQAAALYTNGFRPAVPGSRRPTQLHGKEMSYNNYVDADAARRAAYDFDEPAVAIIKHANPCGIAVGDDVAEAHRKAHACDPVSAFGGVIATNVPVSVEMAEQVAEIFTEVVVAPGYEDGAVEVAAGEEEHPAARVRAARAAAAARSRADLRRAADAGRATSSTRRGRRPVHLDPRHRRGRLDEVLADLAFAWRACRAVKSNAILLAADGASVGVGMGQVNRVDSCRLAVERAGERAAGSVAASDAFFPFADGAADPHRRRRDARSSSPAARSATTRSSPRARPPASRCTSPGPATSSTDGRRD